MPARLRPGQGMEKMSLKANYHVQVIKVGEADVPGPEVYWMSHWETWETLYFYIILIQGEGKTLIVNTGPPADLSTLNQAWTLAYGTERAAMRRTEQERTVLALRRAGTTPSEVDYVLITPLQAYATANIPAFERATICISKRGWIEDFHAPRFALHTPRELRIPNDVLRYLEVEAAGRVRLLEDEEQVIPGIRSLWTGGHHRSSVSYFVDTAKGTVAIADCVFKYLNIEQNLPLGVQESMEECLLAYDRIRKLADIVIPLYDPEVFTRHAYGRVA